MNFPGAGLPTGGGPNGADDPNVKRVQALMESCFAKTAMSGVAGFGLGGIFGMFMASMSYDTPYHTAVPTPTPAAGAVAATGTAAAAGSTGAAGAAVAAGKPSVPGAVISTAATTASTTTSTAATVTAKALPKAAPAAVLTPETISSLPLRQQLAYGFRDMGSRSYSTAKNFGKVGALFSGIECGIEGLRAKNDMGNGVAAGCLTGAILARNGGPQAAAIGCAGFAAFSAAIDAYMRMPPSDD